MNKLTRLGLLLAVTVCAPGYASAVGQSAYYGDFNGDGEIDVFIAADEQMLPMATPIPTLMARPPAFSPLVVWSAGESSEVVSVLTDTTFGYRKFIRNSAASEGLVFVGDFDGDGEGDLFVQSSTIEAPSVRWLAYEQASTAVEIVEDIDGFPVSSAEAVVTISDFSGDGRDDISFTPLGSISTYTAFSDASGGWPEISHVSAATNDPLQDQLLFTAAAVPGGADVVKGVAQYNIPIAIAPGSAGVAPELSISYSSEASYSYLGMGVSLSGLDSINRCAKDFLRNGAHENVAYNSSDALCFGGTPLVLISGANLTDGAEYRTENASYQKVIYHADSGGWFEVFTKDGLVRRYGKATSAAVVIDGVKGVWALDRVSDRVGTYYTIEYAGAGAVLPSVIKYSFNDGAPEVSGFAEVIFDYQSDSYQQIYYRHGELIDYTGLLEGIRNTLDGQLVGEYKFAYKQNPLTGRSTLDRVYQCDGQNRCALPTSFAWTIGGGPDFDVAIDSQLDTVSSRVVHGAWIDVDRDGKTDFCRLHAPLVVSTTHHGMTTNTYTYKPTCTLSDGQIFSTVWEIDKSYSSGDLPNKVFWIDANSDGFPDYCYVGAVGENERIRCYFNQSGQGFSPDVMYVDVLRGVGGSSIGSRYFVDINADGAPDACITHSGSNKKWLRCALNKSSSSNHVFDFHDYYQVGEVFRHSNVDWADVNGDGYPDFCYGKNNDLRCLLNKGGVSLGDMDVEDEYQWRNTSVAAGSSMRRQFVDFNGDGYLDWCRVVSDGGYRGRCILGTGTGWGQEITSAAVSLGGNLSAWIDINDDGRADWCRNYDKKIRCLVSSGTGFSHEVISGTTTVNNGQVVVDDSDTITVSGEYESQDFIDVDGDGLMEFCRFEGGGPSYIRCYFTGDQEYSDYLVAVENGFGLNTTFEYAPISDSSVYSYRVLPEDGVFDVTGGMNVVAATEVSGPSGTLKRSEYRYESFGLRPDRFGPVGYKKVIMSELDASGDVSRQLSVEYSHEIESLEAGLVLNKEMRSFGAGLAGSGVVTETVVNEWLVQSLAGANNVATEGAPPIWDLDPATSYRYAVQLKGTTVSKYDLNGDSLGVSTSTSTFDGFGNVLTSTVTNTLDAGHAFQTDIVNTYDNDATEWVLSRIRTAEVTESVTYGGTTRSSTRKTGWDYYPATHAQWPGQLEKETIEPADPQVVKTYVYDDLGLERTVTVAARDAAPVTTTTYHDSRYRYITRELNPLQHETTHTYDWAIGKRLSSTDPNLLSVSWTYDELGRVKTETSADNSVVTTTYNLCALACPSTAVYYVTKTAEGALGAVLSPPASVYFDEFGREVATKTLGIDGTPIWTLAEFDSLGRSFRVSEPHFDGAQDIYWTTVDSRDALDRPLQKTLPSGQVQTVQYNGLSTTTTGSWVDPLDGSPVTTTYTAVADIKGNKRQVTDQESQVLTYDYDAYGNLLTTTQPGNIVVTQQFDAYGNRIAMNDPDAGDWQYFYDGVGRLLLQENGEQQRVCMVYDDLGRMTSRTDDYKPSDTWQDAITGAKAGCTGQVATTTWLYDTPASGKGRLDSVTHQGGYSRQLNYDALGRVFNETTTYQGTAYTFSAVFDGDGRLSESARPGIEAGRPLVTKNHYNTQYGHLESITGLEPVSGSGGGGSGGGGGGGGGGGTSSVTYWTLVDADARGNATRQTLHGSFLAMEHDYDPATGQVQGIRANFVYGGTVIQDMSFTFDASGALRKRVEDISGSQNIEETFAYDSLRRLTSSTVNNINNQSLNYVQSQTYAGNGNISTKSDVGTYTYGASCTVGGVTYAPGPHAVTSVSGVRNESYCYDNAGRMISHNGKTLSYTAFNKATSIVGPDASLSFVYGPERGLIYSSTVTSTQQLDKVMLAGYEHVTSTESGTTKVEEKYYISDAIVITVTDGEDAFTQRHDQVMFHDHIGSVVATVDMFDGSISRSSFDPWGRRRDWMDWASFTDTEWLDGGFLSAITQKGFTGHEMLDEVGLIHMQGRIYDPTLGRFLSTDPVVQQDYNLQNYNRYTYVLNNPVSYTDPTGYLFGGLIELVSTALGIGAAGAAAAAAAAPVIAMNVSMTREIGRLAAKNKFGAEILQIVGTAGCALAAPAAPACMGAVSAWATTAVAVGNGASFEQGLRAGVQAGVVATVSAGMAGGIGDYTRSFGSAGMGYAAGLPLHGARGAFTAMAMGGDPVAGFASGFVGAIADPAVAYATGRDPVLGAMVAGIASGGASAAAGGKFEHGFVIGATGYLFNELGRELAREKGSCGGYSRQCHFESLSDVQKESVREAASVWTAVVTAPVPVTKAGVLPRIGSWFKGALGIAPRITVRFGDDANSVYHAFRHVDDLGLDRTIVQQAITKHFSGVYSQVVSGRPFNQIIQVSGQRLQYTAYQLGDDLYNIGRIHGVP